MAGPRLPEHSHCIFCGDPVPFGEEYCNDDCRNGEMGRAAKEKRKDRMFYAGATLSVIIILAVGYFI